MSPRVQGQRRLERLEVQAVHRVDKLFERSPKVAQQPHLPRLDDVTGFPLLVCQRRVIEWYIKNAVKLVVQESGQPLLRQVRYLRHGKRRHELMTVPEEAAGVGLRALLPDADLRTRATQHRFEIGDLRGDRGQVGSDGLSHISESKESIQVIVPARVH